MRASSSGLSRCSVLLVVFAALAVLPVRGQDEIYVSLDSPDPFVPAVGQAEIKAVVSSELPIARVAFYVDGVVVGELEAPPYHMTVDLGDSVGAHTFSVVAYGASGATGRGSISTPDIKINEEVAVNLQQFYVTVSRGGERIQDLQQEDFEILDEGRPQEMVTFARGDIPFTALVLLDSSLGMKGSKLKAALGGAREFFNGMQELDEGKLLVFSDRVLHSTPFTTFPAVLTAGLGSVRATGGTALNDHLYLAFKELEKRQGRRVVILLSDGVDSHSVLSMRSVLERARRSQALVYWLRLPYGGSRRATEELPSLRSAWRSLEEHQQEFTLLQNTVEESGGRVYLLASEAEIKPAFRAIREELRDQYVLGYYPANPRRDGSWRKVRIKVDRSGVDVRGRDGYEDL
ncbi:MAG: VWA domain-containing protein [Acidobacteria bacterium]|nr:VWA domain-containing protein [Acidobacteriota bacterium]